MYLGARLVILMSNETSAGPLWSGFLVILRDCSVQDLARLPTYALLYKPRYLACSCRRANNSHGLQPRAAIGRPHATACSATCSRSSFAGGGSSVFYRRYFQPLSRLALLAREPRQCALVG